MVLRLTDLLNLSNVPRWGICPRFKEQSVADHTFRVMAITWELADRLHIPLTHLDYQFMLCHDGDESWSGDISGLAKTAVPELKAATGILSSFLPWMPKYVPDNWPLIKTADIIDCLAFADQWIPDPRRKYIINRNLDVLAAHCAKHDRFNSQMYAQAREILNDIIRDKDRCVDPLWHAAPVSPR